MEQFKILLVSLKIVVDPLSSSNICDCLNLLHGRDVINFVKKSCNFSRPGQGLSKIFPCV